MTPGYLVNQMQGSRRQPGTNIEWAVRDQKQELGDASPGKPQGPALWLLHRNGISCSPNWVGATGELFQWLETIFQNISVGLVRALVGGRVSVRALRGCRLVQALRRTSRQVHAVSLHSRVVGATLVSGSLGSSSLLLYQAMAKDFG